MGKKEIKRTVAGVLSSPSDIDSEIVSILQPTPDGKPIVKIFKSSDSSEDIVEGTFQALKEDGYILEPKKLDLFVRTIDDMKDLGTGFKVEGNLSVGGAGGSFEKSPGKQTEKYVDKQCWISFEIKKKGE
jgi:hypothetical protein